MGLLASTSPAAGVTRRAGREILFRATLVAAFVTVAHQFEWMWLRFATSEAVFRLLALFGMAVERLSPDVLLVDGNPFHYVTACTFADVAMGSVPLLWNSRLGKPANARLLVMFLPLLFAFNI